MERKNKKQTFFSKLIEKSQPAKKDYPLFILRRLTGYNTAIGIFIVFGILSGIFAKSVFCFFFGLMLAVAVFILKAMQLQDIKTNGYEIWQMEVLEHTQLTILNRRPTGMYVEALDGPYVGRVCHVSLQSQSVIPPTGRRIDLYVPGNVQANMVRDVYYIPQYFGIEFQQDECAAAQG